MTRRNYRCGTGLLAAGCLALFSGIGASAQAGAPAAPDAALAAQEEPARAALARAQQELARVEARYTLGQVSADDVLQAKKEVAEAGIRLSAARRQPQAAAVPELETLVALQEQRFELAAQRYKIGLITAAELNASRIALAEARVRLELNRLVALHEQEVSAARAAYEAGAATPQEVLRAGRSLERARQRLAADEADRQPVR